MPISALCPTDRGIIIPLLRISLMHGRRQDEKIPYQHGMEGSRQLGPHGMKLECITSATNLSYKTTRIKTQDQPVFLEHLLKSTELSAFNVFIKKHRQL